MASGLHINLDPKTPLQETLEYFIYIKKIEDDDYSVENMLEIIKKRKGEIDKNKRARKELLVKFPSIMSKNDVSVIVKRRDKKIEIRTKSIEHTAGRRHLLIKLDKSIHHKDEVTVTAKADDGAKLEAKGSFEFKRPKDSENSKFYSTFNLEDSHGKSPNILFDLKIKKEWWKIGEWDIGPALELEVSTKDKNKTRKGSLLFNIQRIFINKRNGQESIFVDVGPKLEMDKEFDNRNLLLDFSITPILLNLFRFSGGNGYIKPILGIELGKNFGLEDKLEVFENYSIYRLTFDLNFSYKWKFDMPQIRDITLSLLFQSRMLLSNETDTIDIPISEQTEDSGETKVISDKGFRFFLSPILSFRLSEYVSVEFKYEYGEKPMLFQNLRKFIIAISYSY